MRSSTWKDWQSWMTCSSHSPPAAVAGLAAAKLGGDGVKIERQARRHSFENGDERLAVRLAGGEETQHQTEFILIVVRTVGSAGSGRL